MTRFTSQGQFVPSFHSRNVLLFTLFFMCISVQTIHGQMTSVVNSLADDEFAHVYDFQVTSDIDESMDGICEDSLHRCTLRAALEEASLLELPARVTFSVIGNLVMDPLQGAFYPPDDSQILGTEQYVTIVGAGITTPIIFAVGNFTLIQGIHLSNALIGIQISGNRNRIGSNYPEAANYIEDMAQNGILITGDSNLITGNVIGLDLTGAPSGSPFGIFVLGHENTIGGIGVGEGNVISGNDKGVSVYTFDFGTAHIIGNSIGTDLSGTSARGNKVGVEVLGFNTVIGGSAPEAMNVISGNTESGILAGLQSTDIYIQGNHIGVDKSGTVLIPNRDGIVLGPGSKLCHVEENLIKSNTQFGIFISGLQDSALESSFHEIFGNEILMNAQAGIGIANNTYDVVVGHALNNTGAANTIQFNGNGGVVFSQTFGTPQNNTIRRNSFKQNNLKGIDIKTFGPNAQDNVLPPEVVEVTRVGGAMFEVVGTHARPGSVIDLYSGDLNGSNNWEGLHWLGSGVVAPDNIFQFNVDDCGCDLVVATATDPQGNTSEFSIGTLVMMTAVRDQQKSDHSVTVFPNPFHDATTIEIELNQPDEIDLSVFDTHGKKVATLCNDHLFAGTHRWSWKHASASDGIYYFRLASGNGSAVTGKLILIE